MLFPTIGGIGGVFFNIFFFRFLLYFLFFFLFFRFNFNIFFRFFLLLFFFFMLFGFKLQKYSILRGAFSDGSGSRANSGAGH
ncbi:unnamed protein product [Meloidogyne enterolobii]|uniref:Uncharacterized protein n=1 Tax=Meloidogyne enterolobii TaxID=390850 RepID=A0ACB1B211_MELEN